MITPVDWNKTIANGQSIEFGSIGVGQVGSSFDYVLESAAGTSTGNEGQGGNGGQDPTPQPTPAPNPHYDPTAKIENSIPSKYSSARYGEGSGTIVNISYTAHDTEANGRTYTKKANVYLPAGYSPDKKYNVLYLLHGIG